MLEMVLPRALGPSGYGNFNFITSLFQQFTNFLDMGTSTCLATSLAKRPGEFGLVAFYSRAAGAMLLLCLLAGGVMYLPGAGGLFLPGVPLWLAMPAALWAFLTWLGRVTRGMNDALGITARSEVARIAVNLFSVLLLALLFWLSWLNLKTLFVQQYITAVLLTLGFCWTMRNAWLAPSFALSGPEKKGYIAEFWKYSSPLFVIALFSALTLSLDRWLLQYFQGSAEQGYFSLSQKVGMACFLFVTAMTPLLMRELAAAHGRNDREGMARLLERFAPMLYAVSAWLACFAAVEGSAVVRIFGGPGFAGALLPVQVMAFYPLHQSYGQVANSVFYATGETRTLRNIILVSLVAGFALSWFFLAPGHFGGLGLGALGLACKQVLTQILTVTVLLLACRRLIPFSLGRNLLHQVICPLLLTALAWLARQGTLALPLGPSAGPARFLISACAYSLAVIAAGCVWPFSLGLSRKDITRIRQLLFHYGRTLLSG